MLHLFVTPFWIVRVHIFAFYWDLKLLCELLLNHFFLLLNIKFKFVTVLQF